MVLVLCSVPQKCSAFQGSATQMFLLADRCWPHCACTCVKKKTKNPKHKNSDKEQRSQTPGSEWEEWGSALQQEGGGKEGMLLSVAGNCERLRWDAGWVPCPLPAPCLDVLEEFPVPVQRRMIHRRHSECCCSCTGYWAQESTKILFGTSLLLFLRNFEQLEQSPKLLRPFPPLKAFFFFLFPTGRFQGGKGVQLNMLVKILIMI